MESICCPLHQLYHLQLELYDFSVPFLHEHMSLKDSSEIPVNADEFLILSTRPDEVAPLVDEDSPRGLAEVMVFVEVALVYLSDPAKELDTMLVMAILELSGQLPPPDLQITSVGLCLEE